MRPIIPILLFPPSLSRYFKFLMPVARKMVDEKFKRELQSALLEEEPEYYIIAFLISSFIWGAVLGGIIFLLLFSIQGKSYEESLIASLVVGIVFFLVFLLLHLIYPSLLSRRVAQMTDRQLIHVLRDMWVQASSGVPLYNILQNVAEGDYGVVQLDLRDAVREISAGERDITVLERVAATTRSESFKRALWHVITSMRTGIGMSAALESAIMSREAEQRRTIKNYGSSLNFYLLLYLLFAAVIPSILTTFFAILSVFGILSIGLGTLIIIISISLMVQAFIIGLVKVSRPEM